MSRPELKVINFNFSISASRTEVGDQITALYEQILTRLSDMRSNQRNVQMLACSRQFNSIMDSMLKKINEHEANFEYSQDNTRQVPMAIGIINQFINNNYN